MEKPLTDKQIVKRIAKGDEHVFEQLFHAKYAHLVLFAMKMIPDRMEAENIVQMVFIKLWEKRNVLKIKSLNAYLMMTVRNHCLNVIKRSRYHYSVDNLPQLPDVEENDIQQKEEMLKLVYSIIDTMPPQRKKIFKMSRLDGLKYKEIANILNISPKTVEAQMGKALKTLRETIAFGTIKQKNTN